MQQLRITPCRNDLGLIQRELKKVNYECMDSPGASDWIRGLYITRLYMENHFDYLDAFPYLSAAIGDLIGQVNGGLDSNVQLRQVIVNKITAGNSLGVHADGPPQDLRFHLPIVTAPGCYWWDEVTNRFTHMTAGNWWGPVPYSGVKHSMVNDSSQERIHVVVDLYVKLT